jgi:hypothetical protein
MRIRPSLYVLATLVFLASPSCSSDDSDDGFVDRGGTSSGGSSGSGPDSSAGSGGGGGTGGLILTDGSGGTNVGPDGSCGGFKVTAAPRQVNMLLVIDKSYSMTGKPAGFATDKWAAMKTALVATVDAAKNQIDFGLELFPTPSSKDCGSNCCQTPTATTLNLPIEDGVSASTKIATLLGAVSPGGATPTAAALKAARTYLTTGAGATLKGDRYVLLATDGGPNCNSSITCSDDRCTDKIDNLCTSDAGMCCAGALSNGCLDQTASVAEVSALATAKIPTFVVGISLNAAYNGVLDALATAGGRAQAGSPKFYAVSASGTAPGGLTAVLQAIARSLITTCRLQFGTAPPDLGLLNVSIDGHNIPKSGADGWDIDATTSPPTIVLKGATCTAIERTGAENVQVIYGCPTEGID